MTDRETESSNTPADDPTDTSTSDHTTDTEEPTSGSCQGENRGDDRWVNRIHEGNVHDVLGTLPESSIHCVVTSPPYWQLRDYGHDDQIGLESSLAEYVDQIVTVGRKIRRVLRDDGSWWLNLGDSYAGSGGAGGQWTADNSGTAQYSGERGDAYNGALTTTTVRRKSKLLVPHRVAIALQEQGWVVRSDAVWAKTNGMPSSVKDRLNETKEFVFHLTPQPDYWFDLDAIREPHAASSVKRDAYVYTSAGNQASHCPDEAREDVALDDEQGLHPRGKNPGDVFEVAVAQCSAAHYSTFPEALIEPPIKAACPSHVCAACGTPYERETETEYRNPGNRRTNGPKYAEQGHESPSFDTRRETVHYPGRWGSQCDCATDATEPGIVLDPFAGMGTTCQVAKRLGRRFVGIELNEDYVAMAQRRVGVDVDEPERLSDDAQRCLTAFTDGGER